MLHSEHSIFAPLFLIFKDKFVLDPSLTTRSDPIGSPLSHLSHQATAQDLQRRGGVHRTGKLCFFHLMISTFLFFLPPFLWSFLLEVLNLLNSFSISSVGPVEESEIRLLAVGAFVWLFFLSEIFLFCMK